MATFATPLDAYWMLDRNIGIMRRRRDCRRSVSQRKLEILDKRFVSGLGNWHRVAFSQHIVW
jgi:hypothetical protein